jgi:hypothetical protein
LDSAGSSRFQGGSLGFEDLAGVPFGTASPGELASFGVMDHPLSVDEVDPNNGVFEEPLDHLEGVDMGVITDLDHHIIDPHGVEILAISPLT